MGIHGRSKIIIPISGTVPIPRQRPRVDAIGNIAVGDLVAVQFGTYKGVVGTVTEIYIDTQEEYRCLIRRPDTNKHVLAKVSQVLLVERPPK